MFYEFPVRTMGAFDDPLFVAQDVCNALGFPNTSDACAGIPEADRGIAKIPTSGGDQELLILREPGLYRLIFGGNEPLAEKFLTWIFQDVLPQLRRTCEFLPGSTGEREWLRSIVPSAKSAAIQVMLLQKLGIEEAKVVSSRTGSVVHPVDSLMLWNCLLNLYKSSRLQIEWFRCCSMPNDEFFLVFAPGYVIPALKRSDTAWHSFDRIDFRTSLAATPEWVADQPTERLGRVGHKHSVR
jgi:prophage antirepressor-like protein